MGTITHYNGDLFRNNDRKVIAHGVNCRGAFGSGFAGQVARRYPDVKRAYVRKHESTGWKPGDCQFVMTDNRTVVVNMATQETFGKTGTHVDYDAVRACLEQVLDFCVNSGDGLAMPKVGSGLAGGDWEMVEGILRDCLATRDVEVDVYTIE